MRILIVEDDRDLAAALDDALRFEGYATRVAYNGLEAVRMLAETGQGPREQVASIGCSIKWRA